MRECWLVEPRRQVVTVVKLTVAAEPRRFTGSQVLQSAVLPGLIVEPLEIFT